MADKLIYRKAISCIAQPEKRRSILTLSCGHEEIQFWPAKWKNAQVPRHKVKCGECAAIPVKKALMAAAGKGLHV